LGAFLLAIPDGLKKVNTGSREGILPDA
jgi:hypothetical protein